MKILISAKRLKLLIVFIINSANQSGPAQVKGLYLWGDVGRGKIFLLDLFYDCLPQKGKLQLHFHPFMARIHQALNEQTGQQDPLIQIAKNLAQKLHYKRYFMVGRFVLQYHFRVCLTRHARLKRVACAPMTFTYAN
ncbi:AFG1/ZapE family ATPase [Paraglaciecola polaris]|uniref:AFG1/ZapE family ATPase n=1 Tax=Paraglaciecola polaris TaxID=222814 RepID=UPI00058C2101|nr:AFG1/ZapE family ATPase [Paraglaciecola polaris]